MRLAGKAVVVTGAGSGIGRATALAFAAEGARIAACDVDAARLAALRAELGERALVVERVDVADRAQMAAFAEAVHARVPAADVVVNNAGVGCGGDFVGISLDDWDWLLGVNLRGVVHGCHFFVPKMVARGAGGHVVNVSSILGIYPAPTLSAYVASKFAVLGLSQSLRAELAPHRIGVTAICPGMIATSIVDDARTSGELHGRKAKMSALYRRRGAKPEVVARAILDAVQANPAIRPVGRDAWVIWAMTRVAPRTAARLGAVLMRRLGAGD
ncbi:MAG TPA: SDR family NAD(P)-dependent oxidoreductase [Kofleriaceae bacterium]|nr:SDR family NAD(P)-dependent oxidoreductase [Kofleriaceae bacterium]